MTKPNFYMIYRIMNQLNKVLHKNPDSDRMPSSGVLPEYDIRLIKPITILKYVYEIKTQWSCQGNHKEEIGRAYLMLEPNESFPNSLLQKCEASHLYLDLVDEVIFKNGLYINTGLKRQSLKPLSDIKWGLQKSTNTENHKEHNEQIKNYPKLSISEKFNLNENFLITLDQWADDEFALIEKDFYLFIKNMPNYMK